MLCAISPYSFRCGLCHVADGFHGGFGICEHYDASFWHESVWENLLRL